MRIPSFKMYSISSVLFILSLASVALSTNIPTTPRGVPKKQSSYERNFNTISKIYNFTIYPNQLPIIAQAASPNIAQVADLFSPSVAGRIQDIGNFTNFRTSIEYFFGLAPVPRAPNYIGISAFDLTQFSSNCPEVAASTVYFTISVADPQRPDFGKVLTYLKQSGFWHFDSQGRVDYYDLYIPALQDFASLANGADFSSPLVQLLALREMCAGADKVCTGSNKQYKAPLISLPPGDILGSITKATGIKKDVLDLVGLDKLNSDALVCFTTLASRNNFGTFDKLWDDSVTCRIVHLTLAAVDPEEHCPHVGPTGGGKCVKWSYTDRLFNDLPLFKEKYRFRCPDRYREL